MGWVYAATKLPLVGAAVDRIYELWADRRLALTGRADLATIIATRQQRQSCLVEGRCQPIE